MGHPGGSRIAHQSSIYILPLVTAISSGKNGGRIGAYTGIGPACLQVTDNTGRQANAFVYDAADADGTGAEQTFYTYTTPDAAGVSILSSVSQLDLPYSARWVNIFCPGPGVRISSWFWGTRWYQVTD